MKSVLDAFENGLAVARRVSALVTGGEGGFGGNASSTNSGM